MRRRAERLELTTARVELPQRRPEVTLGRGRELPAVAVALDDAERLEIGDRVDEEHRCGLPSVAARLRILRPFCYRICYRPEVT